jgi:hypothetical protein
MLRDLDLDPLMSSRVPSSLLSRSLHAMVQPPPPQLDTAGSSLTRPSKSTPTKFPLCVSLCPLATSGHGWSSAHAGAPPRSPPPSYAVLDLCCIASTTTIIAYKTPLLPSPTRPSYRGHDYKQCNTVTFGNKICVAKKLQQELSCKKIRQQDLCCKEIFFSPIFFCKEACVAKGFSQHDFSCESDDDA